MRNRNLDVLGYFLPLVYNPPEWFWWDFIESGSNGPKGRLRLRGCDFSTLTQARIFTDGIFALPLVKDRRSLVLCDLK